MNISFENIFDKFNIKREISKKRHRVTKVQSNRKKLPILTKAEAGNSMPWSSASNTEKNVNCVSSRYLNNHSTSKYGTPTRYNRLEVISIDSVEKSQNPVTESFQSSTNFNISGKENGPGKKLQSNKRNLNVELETNSDSQMNTTLGSIENVNNKQNDTTSNKKYLGTVSFDEMNISKYSETETTEAFVTQSPTELDLLIDLIQQEDTTNKNDNAITDKITGKLYNHDDRLLVTKPRLKGGYQEMFECALKHEKAKSNFLKYDKKIGLRAGKLLTIIKIQNSHGLTLATVKSHDLNKNVAVVVAREMAPRLTKGSQIETFFDDKTQPYKLLLNGEYIDVYLEPYKLISD